MALGITEHLKAVIKQLEQELELSKAAFLNVVGKNRDGIVIFDLSGKIIYANPAAVKLFGRNLGSLLGENIGIFVDKEKTEITILNKERGPLIVEVSIADTSWNNQPAKLASLHDMTEHKKVQRELEYLSTHDKLTNLYNRQAFEYALKNEVARAKSNNTSFALMLMDLDNFKTVNDTYGHHIGDKLLISVAKQIRHNIRKDDIAARLGGDEFILLLPNIKDIKEVDAFAHRLVKRFNKPFKLENHYFHSTISVGIAMAPSLDHDETSLLKKADIALYNVKELGRNNYQFFSDQINYVFKQRSDLETMLPLALQNDQFYIEYQPIFCLPDKKVVGIEALLRWQHPKLGLIKPNEFVPLAEKNGFILPIGDWVLRTVCQQYSAWQKAGLLPKQFRCAVNIATKHISQVEFLNSILNIIKQAQLPSNHLELELTESALMNNNHELDKVLMQLRNAGIRISLDNFGIGASSLVRLKQLPIDTLKLDKSLIKDLSQDNEDAMIVKAIIVLGSNLGLDVICEGVETEEQLNLLIKFNCPMAQGFYFGKKLFNVIEMTHLLAKII